MDIDVKIDKESLHIEVENAYRVDVPQVTNDIHDFGNKLGVDLTPLNIENLIPRMIRGVAGCEGGCPSDAMRMVREGFGKFKLKYVEGGILTAVQTLESGKLLEVRIFPDFD
ncbi:hypothetical protein BMS3Abin09_00039 [bacterium BMS3Abin09]|nr:hypothetical protein BMS3Abin09_00039 [bacterium BMS3Abin09]GBE41901.1 hypothetical protein BMS3Bbin09_01812 [bacterium BMS3Bbin09]HDH34437.1 hypothetical protein [Nitrospirota bacterium]HDO66630.1 hypothetical protein [Nitrospirota bacterium]HEW80804.1 hypothetical protein [Nitrospirota bacterium]